MILFWNVRGLNNPRKKRRLKFLIQSLHISVISLLETHASQENQAAIIKRLKPNYQVVDNYAHATQGRIWILDEDTVTLSVHSGQAVHCHLFSNLLQRYFFMTVVYASNCEFERRLLWRELIHLKEMMTVTVPWVLLGDLNVIQMQKKGLITILGCLLHGKLWSSKNVLMRLTL